MKLAVFVSGRGSNLRSIYEHPAHGSSFRVEAVVSDKAECGAFEIARSHSTPTYVCCEKREDGTLSFAPAAAALKEREIDAVALAGFLKLVPPEILGAYRDRVFNVHPALLPSFGGAGMYGMRVHRAVFESGAKVSGATIHLADEEYDRGPIVAQACVDIADADSPEEIARRVLEVEHRLYPETLARVAENKLSISDGRATLKP